MKLCEEIKQWRLFLPNQPQMMVSYAERMPKRKARSRSRRKRKPPVEPDKMTITLSDIGQRTVAVERMVPKREQVHRQLSSVEEEGEGTDDGDKKSHNMSTQTTLHDLEFLITDPLIQEAPGRGRARLPREVVYTRQTTAQRTYKTGRTTVNVEHQSVDNIVVHIDKSILANPTGRTDRSDGLQHKEDERKDKNHEQNPPDVEEADRKSVKKNRITFTEDVTPTEERKKSETTRETPCVSKVAKPSTHKLPMVRVGGGWMEMPDYLHFHVPMHVHSEIKRDGSEGNMIIRSQRPRSQMFSKKGENPSWTATLSRGTTSSASTIMRQRLV